MQPDTPFNRDSRELLDPAIQSMWDRSRDLHGDTTFFEVMGNAPEATHWYMNDFYKGLFQSGRVDPRIVELIRLRLANVHGCAFCNRSDRIAALAAGLSEAEVDAIGDYENGPFDERQKAALALADVMALTNPMGHVSKDLYARLKQSFSDAELVELGLIMAVLTGVAKFIFAYDLVEKEDYCPFMPTAVA
ncbi:MAG: carboxymuconolactone decarboxylase family protein [Sphingobium sp.]